MASRLRRLERFFEKQAMISLSQAHTRAKNLRYFRASKWELEQISPARIAEDLSTGENE
jgi:hypothetical protein